MLSTAIVTVPFEPAKEKEMKKTLIVMTTLATLTLAACSYDQFGGPVAGTGQAPAAQPQFETEIRYLGTAPFCAAKRGDCYNLGDGWEFDSFTKTGSGKSCATGTKAKCVRQVQVN